jgi:hypothetical protein
MEFIKGLLYTIFAQILTFLQLQGQFKFLWMKNNMIIVSLLGIPISILYILSTKYLVSYFNNQLWPSRLIGFMTGIVIFTFMSSFIFKESLTIKTTICLILSILVVLIQLFWK